MSRECVYERSICMHSLIGEIESTKQIIPNNVNEVVGLVFSISS